MTAARYRPGVVGAPVVERVDPTEAASARALAALRRASVVERRGPQDDPGFDDELAAWWAREAPQRTAWLASVDGEPVGMMNVLEFTRMPTPGAPAGRWGYLGNAFVLAFAPGPGDRRDAARRGGRRGPGARLRADRAQPLGPVGAVLTAAPASATPPSSWSCP